MIRIYLDMMINKPQLINEKYVIEVYRKSKNATSSYYNNERKKVSKIQDKKMCEYRKMFYKLSQNSILWRMANNKNNRSVFYSNISLGQIRYIKPSPRGDYDIGVVPIFTEKNTNVNGKKLVDGDSTVLYNQPLYLTIDQMIFYRTTNKLTEVIRKTMAISNKGEILRDKPLTIVKAKCGEKIYYRFLTNAESKQYNKKYYKDYF